MGIGSESDMKGVWVAGLLLLAAPALAAMSEDDCQELLELSYKEAPNKETWQRCHTELRKADPTSSNARRLGCGEAQQAFVDAFNRRELDRSFVAKCEPGVIVAHKWHAPMKWKPHLVVALTARMCGWIWEDDFDRPTAKALGFKRVRAEYGDRVFHCPVQADPPEWRDL